MRLFLLDGTSPSATTVHARYSTAEIATTLEIAPSTVADHIKNIYARLDVHSMRELSAQINQQMLRREH
jgi:DNA-binding CsgD family transcriptional regulator